MLTLCRLPIRSDPGNLDPAKWRFHVPGRPRIYGPSRRL